ncbi:MAG TPA: glutathione binding-like protein [Nevskiaceae bacterium]
MTRRVEFDVTEDMMAGFRYGEGLKIFENRMRCVPEAATGLKARGQDGVAWLDGLLDGRTWLAGERFSLADIALRCRVDFCTSVDQPLNPQLRRFGAWFERVNARPSATASLSPDAQASGLRV